MTLKQFENFEKEWKLVTVRYREDSKEMRFTYANPIAYEALVNGKEYPDKAVFAKIGMGTGNDPAFISSRIPSEARRYQFMMRDKKKFSETGGWGYALFDSDGFLFDKNVDYQSKACHACHNIVADRQFVFSQMAVLDPFKKHQPAKLTELTAGRLTFETTSRSVVPKSHQSKIPQKYKMVRVYRGEVANNLFRGSVDELKATLINEVQQHQMPAVVLPKSMNSVIIVNPSTDNKRCESEIVSKKAYDFSFQVDLDLCSEK